MPQQAFERQSGEGERIASAGGTRRTLVERRAALPGDHVGEIAHLSARDAIVVDDVQRMADLLHMQRASARQPPPTG